MDKNTELFAPWLVVDKASEDTLPQQLQLQFGQEDQGEKAPCKIGVNLTGVT